MTTHPTRWALDDGRIVLDTQGRQVWRQGARVPLGGRAFDILCLLLQQQGQLLSHQALLQQAWAGRVVQENNLHVQVKALRGALGRGIVSTVPGRGYQLGCSAEPLAAPPAEPHESLLHPGPRTLYGREALCRQACEALANEHVRLLTFTGPAGVGKTSLAQQVLQQRVLGRPADAVTLWLAPLQDAALLLPALADALGVQAGAGDTLTQAVVAHLRHRPCVLCLDNLEHLLPQAAKQVAAWLAQCPQIQILATSRARLRLAGEHELRVPPLRLPAGGAVEQILASPAVHLFMARAQESGRRIDPQPDQLAAVAQVCTGLDGLPLAIELAAARLRVLSPQALAQRLLPRMPLLKAAHGPLPTRHQTLHGAIAWSHELLQPEAQALFARLGVCVGGFSLALAEALTESPLSVLDALEQLLDQSLVQRVDDVLGLPRYTMLETIREFALDGLVKAGQEGAARRRHAEFMAEMVLGHDRLLRSGRRADALKRLRAERHNLRAALQWAVHQARDGDVAARLVAGAAWWWYFDDAAAEGLQWARHTLALPPAPAWRPGTLLAVARLGVLCAQADTAQACADQAAELAARAGDVDTQAQALQMKAFTLMGGAPQQACALLDRCIALFGTLPSEWDVALATGIKGMALAWQPGGEAHALAALAASHARFTAQGDAWCLTPVSHHLAMVHARLGQLQLAQRHAEETLDMASRVGYGFMVASAKHMLARISLAQGDVAQAGEWTRRSIATSWQLGHRRDALLHCRWLAFVLLQGDPRAPVVPLFAVGVDELDEQLMLAATVMTPQERGEWDAALADLRARRPSDEWAQAWQTAAAEPPERTLRVFGVL